MLTGHWMNPGSYYVNGTCLATDDRELRCRCRGVKFNVDRKTISTIRCKSLQRSAVLWETLDALALHTVTWTGTGKYVRLIAKLCLLTPTQKRTQWYNVERKKQNWKHSKWATKPSEYRWGIDGEDNWRGMNDRADIFRLLVFILLNGKRRIWCQFSYEFLPGKVWCSSIVLLPNFLGLNYHRFCEYHFCYLAFDIKRTTELNVEIKPIK